ncbi:hypothetical protein ABKN59_006428 [Abortiporus biennis]
MEKPPVLYQEILDYIIDFLHADKASLRSCTLTSRLFLPSADIHLFHLLYIDGSKQNFEDLARFLHRTERVSKNVRELHLRGRIRSRNYYDFLPKDQITELCLSTLRHLLDSLPFLHSLELDHLLWTGELFHDPEVDGSSQQQRPFRRKHLDNLILRSVITCNALGTSIRRSTIYDADYVVLLCVFAGVKKLYVEGVYSNGRTIHPQDVTRTVEALRPMIHRGTYVESLHMKWYIDSMFLFEILRCTDSVQKLKEMEITVANMTQVVSLQSLINDCGSCLTSLTLHTQTPAILRDSPGKCLYPTTNNVFASDGFC